ncbi:hypothetical protein L208DRAFT_1378533 [Tricholoma matsutake]|nr:hypothetical protein L208DRAFT_1378533 [Tricholoma matsutake 945]
MNSSGKFPQFLVPLDVDISDNLRGFKFCIEAQQTTHQGGNVFAFTQLSDILANRDENFNRSPPLLDPRIWIGHVGVKRLNYTRRFAARFKDRLCFRFLLFLLESGLKAAVKSGQAPIVKLIGIFFLEKCKYYRDGLFAYWEMFADTGSIVFEFEGDRYLVCGGAAQEFISVYDLNLKLGICTRAIEEFTPQDARFYKSVACAGFMGSAV